MIVTAMLQRDKSRHHLLLGLAGCIAIIAIAAAIERAMGRNWICKCGHIRLWVGDVGGPENSQQIADWYSFSHIIHGFVLYGMLWLIGRGKWPLAACLLAAVMLEAGWEILENSPIIIDRYRQTQAQDYYGDSILNSMSDIAFCLIGFLVAWRVPVKWTLAMIAVMEVGVGYMIHDNLLLNIIMLIHPFESIKHWQTNR
jgi:hypothetical protein